MANVNARSIDEIQEFFWVMVNDCSCAAKQWAENDCGYTRRSYVRAVFAFIEGNTHRMKQLCIQFHESERCVALSKEELEKAAEVKFDEQGNKKIIKIPTLDNVKLSFSLFSKVFGRINSLDCSGSGWGELEKALEIRHRLTHPKSISYLELKSSDMETIEKAVEFYRDTTIAQISV